MAVTAAKVNDITAAKAMPIEAGATYVFDLGYCDYGWWARLDGAGCRIVTRLKSNTPLEIAEEIPVPGDGAILSDRIGYLPVTQANSRKNPYLRSRPGSARYDRNRHEIRLVTNDLDASAEDIAALYKRRWEIELYFRWVKQNLKIKKFLGASENAVRIQIAVALIVYLLLKLAHKEQQAVTTLLAFTRLVKANLMQLKRIDRLLSNEPSEIENSSQMVFECL